jgi:hypothetical protein
VYKYGLGDRKYKREVSHIMGQRGMFARCLSPIKVDLRIGAARTRPEYLGERPRFRLKRVYDLRATVQAHSRGYGSDTEGGDHLIALAEHGHGHGAHSRNDLLIIKGTAFLARLDNKRFEQFRGEEGVIAKPVGAGCEGMLNLVVRKERKERQAPSTDTQRPPAANLESQGLDRKVSDLAVDANCMIARLDG